HDSQLPSNTATVTLSVTALGNHAPVANNDSFLSGPCRVPLVTTVANGVLANDTDSDGDFLVVTLLGYPPHGNLQLAPSGAFTYTPFIDYAGSDAFTYRITDGQVT